MWQLDTRHGLRSQWERLQHFAILPFFPQRKPWRMSLFNKLPKWKPRFLCEAYYYSMRVEQRIVRASCAKTACENFITLYLPLAAKSEDYLITFEPLAAWLEN